MSETIIINGVEYVAKQKTEAVANSKVNSTKVMAVKGASKGYKTKKIVDILNNLPRTTVTYKGKTYEQVKFDGHLFNLVFNQTAWMRVDY